METIKKIIAIFLMFLSAGLWLWLVILAIIEETPGKQTFLYIGSGILFSISVLCAGYIQSKKEDEDGY
jgi:hypothetical protein